MFHWDRLKEGYPDKSVRDLIFYFKIRDIFGGVSSRWTKREPFWVKIFCLLRCEPCLNLILWKSRQDHFWIHSLCWKWKIKLWKRNWVQRRWSFNKFLEIKIFKKWKWKTMHIRFLLKPRFINNFLKISVQEYPQTFMDFKGKWR